MYNHTEYIQKRDLNIISKTSLKEKNKKKSDSSKIFLFHIQY